MSSAKKPDQPSLRVRVGNTAESIIRKGHPWVFNESIRSQNREGSAGEMAIIFDRNDRFLAVGLYDPDSALRIRVLHAGKPTKLDDAWWQARFERSLATRAEVAQPGTDGLRWINGESDGFPALVLDQYADVCVLKIYSAAWFPHLSQVQKMILERLKPSSLFLRMSRNIQKLAAEQHGMREGQLLAGRVVKEPVIFQESGIRFYADVMQGQKTGFFLDQRENRRRVEQLAAGKSVLNLFSFSGGFSLYAARGGAQEVTSVDISAHALAELEKNWSLNLEQPGFKSCKHEEVQADVFEWLEQGKRRCDLMIIDPPSLAKKEKERATAITAYERLSYQGVQMLKRGGILVSASCSAHVSAEEFYSAVRLAVSRSGRTFRELGVTGHAPDHPASIPEMSYLKAIYFQEQI